MLNEIYAETKRDNQRLLSELHTTCQLRGIDLRMPASSSCHDDRH